MNLPFLWALVFLLSTTLSVAVLSFHVKTSSRHKASWTRSTQVFANRNNQVSRPPDDTSVASRIDEATPFLQQVGRSYTDKDAWEKDIHKLHELLHLTRYHHSTIKKHIFNLPINKRTNDRHNHEDEQSLEKYKHEYPFGPTYVRPIAVGQSIDLRQFIDINSTEEWLPSLQVLTTLFLLSSCVPSSLFTQTVVGGNDTLDLLLRLGLVYLSPDDNINNDGELVVPVVHLFPLQIPQLPGTIDRLDLVKDMVFMTDLHPNVLSVTTIPSGSDCPEEGAVMYIGPDSLALVHHLHASFLGYLNNGNTDSSVFRVLDVCSGSGVQALAALGMLDVLRKSGHELAAVDVEAVAVDVNQRALRFTEFNARLNRMKVTTVQSDLLADDAMVSIEELVGRGESKKFDILLANPPFIPTPNLVSDDAALSLRETNSIANNAQSYGLFSSGGVSGEDCLCAIIQMAPRVLRSDGGLMAIVSEFMNPPLRDLDEQKCMLLTKVEQWWGSHDVAASGVLFTNEHPLESQVYAQRRALTDDHGVISLWLNHLERYQIEHVSPGLLFVQYQNKGGNTNNAPGCNIDYRLVPKTNNGSLWTPHNFNAVEYTMKMLNDLYQS